MSRVVGLARASRVFLRILRSSSLSKIKTYHKLGCVVSCRMAAAKGAFNMPFDLTMHVDLRPSQFSYWLQVRTIITLFFPFLSLTVKSRSVSEHFSIVDAFP